MHILVAEDDKDAALMYKIILEAKGHRVTLTHDGYACLDAYRNMNGKECDAILLDYRMPKMDGLQTAREIVKINPNQRMIFTSTTVKETLRESVKELEKVVEIIEKPFEPDVLVRAIEDLTAIEKLRETNSTRIDNKSLDGRQVDNLLKILKKIQAAGTI